MTAHRSPSRAGDHRVILPLATVMLLKVAHDFLSLRMALRDVVRRLTKYRGATIGGKRGIHAQVYGVLAMLAAACDFFAESRLDPDYRAAIDVYARVGTVCAWRLNAGH